MNKQREAVYHFLLKTVESLLTFVSVLKIYIFYFQDCEMFSFQHNSTAIEKSRHWSQRFVDKLTILPVFSNGKIGPQILAWVGHWISLFFRCLPSYPFIHHPLQDTVRKCNEKTCGSRYGPADCLWITATGKTDFSSVKVILFIANS